MRRAAYRTIHHGRERLRVPAAWDAFRWHDRTYRVRDGAVEFYSETAGRWRPSMRLLTSAPAGRRAA